MNRYAGDLRISQGRCLFTLSLEGLRPAFRCRAIESSECRRINHDRGLGVILSKRFLRSEGSRVKLKRIATINVPKFLLHRA
jgi:hypothetical protein